MSWKPKIKMNLKNKITFNICIIVTLSLIVMCLSLYAMSAAILRKDSDTFSEVQILRAQEKIELQVEKIRLETLAMSRDQKIREFFKGNLTTDRLNDDLTRRMADMNQASGSYYYKDLFCVDESGRITASTMPEAMYVDLSGRTYIKDSLAYCTTQTSEVLDALTDSANIVNTTHPVYDEDGKLMGLFGIAVKAENFVDFIKDYAIGENGSFTIVDANGYILSHKNAELIGKPAGDVLPAFLEMTFQDPGNIYNYYDKDFLYSYKKLAKNNWILCTTMPRRELAAKSLSLLKYVVVYGLIISGCAIFASIYFSNRISAPIVSITNYINKAKSSNEFLGDSLGETIENVNRSMDKDAFSLIQKSKALTDSLEMKSYLTARFLSALSHDIRTSLTLIKGYAKGILSGLAEDDETKMKFIREIYESADTLEQISYDVLDSTYEAQYSSRLKKEMVSAEEFCRTLYQTARAYVENSDRLFEGSVENAAGKSLCISRVKIIRVWQNMLSNAVKYSEKYSTVTIRIACEQDELLFQVADQGVGISEKDKEYIFDMFYKGDPSRKESYGLGLFVSKLILEAHGSRMCFESNPGEGSRFWFALRISEENVSEDLPQTDSPHPELI